MIDLEFFKKIHITEYIQCFVEIVFLYGQKLGVFVAVFLSVLVSGDDKKTRWQDCS